MDRMISLSVGTDGDEDYASTFQDLSELARSLGSTHVYVNVTASVVDGEEQQEGHLEEVYYDENTLLLVLKAIREWGCTEKTSLDIITAIQNAGILFRERPKKGN